VQIMEHLIFGSANSVQQTKDGGYIVVGYTFSYYGDIAQNTTGYDVWVLRLNSKGVLLWEKTYGGTSWDFASHVQQTADDGFIVSGTSYSHDGDVEKNNGASDIWILKLDRLGNKKWAKSYGGESEDFASSVKQTFDGGYIVAGTSISSSGDVGGNNGDYDFWIVKLDKTGDLIWEGNFGKTFYESANSVLQVEDGSYVVAGNTISNEVDVNTNTVDQDPWILKLDINGNLLWEKSYGGKELDSAQSIQQSDNGGYVIAGTTTSFSDDMRQSFRNCLIIKVDKLGTLEWKTIFGTEDPDAIYSIEQTRDGGYTVAGYTDINNDVSDYFVIKVNVD